jgi:hypothetical protein
VFFILSEKGPLHMHRNKAFKLKKSPKIFTLLKERDILNILNKPDGICVALCIPSDEI